jgi:hypothetical protein
VCISAALPLSGFLTQAKDVAPRQKQGRYPLACGKKKSLAPQYFLLSRPIRQLLASDTPQPALLHRVMAEGAFIEVRKGRLPESVSERHFRRSCKDFQEASKLANHDGG